MNRTNENETDTDALVPSDHGNSPAAWTAVAVMIAGSVVCALAFPLTSPALFAAGLVVMVLGLAVGKVMAMAGYGALPSYETQEPNPTSLEGATLGDDQRGARS